MSTVAFKGGRFASDSQISDATLKIGTCSTKVGVVNSRVAYGFAGSLSDLTCLINWIQHDGLNRRDGDGDFTTPMFQCDTSEALVCCRSPKGDGVVICTDEAGASFAADLYHVSKHGVFKNALEAEFFALGSGMELALGAMAAGAGPQVAVEIACRFDGYSSLPVHVSRVPA